MVDKVFYYHRDIERGLISIARKLHHDEWKPDYIVGLNRGGLYPSVFLSHYLNCNHYALDVRLRDEFSHPLSGPEHNSWMAEDAHNGMNILIVDDINDSGATFKWIVDDWECENLLGNNIRTAAVIENLPSSFSTNYHHYEINKEEHNVWVVFPWEAWWEM